MFCRSVKVHIGGAVGDGSERVVTTMRTDIILDEICDWRVPMSRIISFLK